MLHLLPKSGPKVAAVGAALPMTTARAQDETPAAATAPCVVALSLRLCCATHHRLTALQRSEQCRSPAHEYVRVIGVPEAAHAAP